MSYFSYVNKLFSNVKGFYQEINAATLTGAIDTLIVEQKDGTYKSSPFHIRFGKLGVLRAREKVVDIEINGEVVDIQMKLGDSGEAFFIEEHEHPETDLPEYLATSPLQYDSDIMETGLQTLKQQVQMAEEQSRHCYHDTLSSQSKNSTTNLAGERKHLDSVRSENSSRDADIDIRIENEAGELIKRKKRRRKRKNKHKYDSANNNQANPDDNDTASDDIFEIEYLSTDEELSRLTLNMSKSVSLPEAEESKFHRTSDWASAHEVYMNNHPFSDTDLSPLASPMSSRPHTPKSDTEVDRQKNLEQERLIPETEDDTLWEWGNLPRKSTTEDDRKQGYHNSPTAEEKVKMSGGLFNFMRKTKNMRHKPEEEGIYLDDLRVEDMDEETAKLYFPKRFSHCHFKSIEKDEDVESGQGASLPQSPHSVEGAIGGPSVTLLPSEIKSLGSYALSLCGGLTDQDGVTLEKFMSKIVTYDDLCENPAMYGNPDLVVKIEDNYYNWQTAVPMIVCQTVFQKQLPEHTIKELVSQHMPKKKGKKGGYSWFTWRRANPNEQPPVTTSTSNTISEQEIIHMKDKPIESAGIEIEKTGESSVSCSSNPKDQSPKEEDMMRLTVTGDHSSSEGDTEGSDQPKDKMKQKRHSKPVKVYKRSLRLSSEQIKRLNLRPGQNEVTYSVTTQYQGTKRCTSNIYLWKYDDKIIVSDIDGTITKSDVLGQILPVVGRDWSQSGVAQLYSRIHGNGYKFLYLSARAIGQSKLTKDLLQNIKQGKMTLPAGPLLLSPTSLISAFHKEVIERKPEEFKISCLRDVGSLFPDKANPFYAGFGNKVNDVYAYKAINIPIFRIFTINPHGELRHELSLTFQTSYTKLTDVADHFFPPLHKICESRSLAEYNAVHFWREPLPEVSPIEVENVITGGTSGDPEIKETS